MARYPRLALAEDVGELGYGQLALGTEQKETQPGRFGDRPKATEDGFHINGLIC